MPKELKEDIDKDNNGQNWNFSDEMKILKKKKNLDLEMH